MTGWDDTTGVERPPAENPWRAARWLVGRYPRVQRLVERVGAIDDDEEGRWVHIDMLADIVRASDAYACAWERYRHSNYEPGPRVGESDEAYNARWDVYEAAGPKPEEFAEQFDLAGAHGIVAYGPMSSGEKRLLRVLATVGWRRVGFCIGDLDGLDDEGEQFLRDWLRILLPDTR